MHHKRSSIKVRIVIPPCPSDEIGMDLPNFGVMIELITIPLAFSGLKSTYPYLWIYINENSKIKSTFPLLSPAHQGASDDYMLIIMKVFL